MRDLLIDVGQLVEWVEADELGKLRDHFTALNGFNALRHSCALVNALLIRPGGVTRLVVLIGQVHKWQE